MQDTKDITLYPAEEGGLCPVCASRNIRRISFAEKLGLALLKGERAFLEMQKTFRCGDCGKEW